MDASARRARAIADSRDGLVMKSAGLSFNGLPLRSTQRGRQSHDDHPAVLLVVLQSGLSLTTGREIWTGGDAVAWGARS